MPFTDLNAVQKVVYNIIVNWLADWQHKSTVTIQSRLDWTLTGTPPNGYDMQQQTYTKLCSDTSSQVKKALGRDLILKIAWRTKHKNDSVSAFITAVSIEVVSAKLTTAGKGALKWSSEK